MKVQFLGCGDAFGTGGRFNTCFLVTASQRRFLIDCGASSMVAMRKYGIDPNGIDTVFLTHLHGDHFGGLPFMILDAQLYSRRTAPLRLVGPPGLADRLTAAMEVFFPGSSGVERKFATEIVEFEPGTGDAWKAYERNGVRATPSLARHGSGAPSLSLRFECEGRVIAYTGDTEWTDALIECGKAADLFIAEALFFDRAVRGHLDYATLRDRLDDIGPKRLMLTHLGPDMMERLSDLAFDVAEDGLEVAV